MELYRGSNGEIPCHSRGDWRIANLDLVNGTLHWLVLAEHGRLRNATVVTFDLKTERFLELPMPDIDLVLLSDCVYCDYGLMNNDDEYALFARLGVVEGRLCLCVGADSSSQYPIELWVMNEGQSWTRLLDSPFQNKLEVPTHEQRLCQCPLCISKDNQIILVDENFRLTRFDAGGETRNTEHTSAIGYYRWKVVSYLETLILPNFNNAV